MSRFYHYNAVFDPEEIIWRHFVPNLAPHPDYLTNYLGVLIDPKFYPTLLDEFVGQLEGPPIPANWHADMAEWGAALRAVDLARETFTVVELGCGWGCWLNNTGRAAERAGLRVQLIGVEGDPGHIGFAKEATQVNNFSSEAVHLHHGIACAAGGIALFPRQDQAGIAWGLAPVFGATRAEREEGVASGRMMAVPMLTVADIVAGHTRVDLLHIDIQGGEADLVEGSLENLKKHVAYIVIGTHSRPLEGRLMAMLRAEGWQLEIERPAFLYQAELSGQVEVDGVQGWRNPRLLP